MSLKEQIKEDIKTAMREKENFKRDTLRMLSAAMKQIEVDERVELDDEKIISIIQKQIKQRQDAITQYKEGGRDELAQKEEDEINVLIPYLPKQLDDNELETIIKNIIQKTGATSSKDMGKIMGASSKEIGASADNKRISIIAKKLLENL